LQRKHCDLIVVNDPTSINGTTSNVEILDATGETLAQISGDKTDVARRLIAEIQAFVAKQTAAPNAPADL